MNLHSNHWWTPFLFAQPSIAISILHCGEWRPRTSWCGRCCGRTSGSWKRCRMWRTDMHAKKLFKQAFKKGFYSEEQKSFLTTSTLTVMFGVSPGELATLTFVSLETLAFFSYRKCRKIKVATSRKMREIVYPAMYVLLIMSNHCRKRTPFCQQNCLLIDRFLLAWKVATSRHSWYLVKGLLSSESHQNPSVEHSRYAKPAKRRQQHQRVPKRKPAFFISYSLRGSWDVWMPDRTRLRFLLLWWRWCRTNRQKPSGKDLKNLHFERWFYAQIGNFRMGLFGGRPLTMMSFVETSFLLIPKLIFAAEGALAKVFYASLGSAVDCPKKGKEKKLII